MSPLFYAQATGLFAAEGLKVDMKFHAQPGRRADGAHRNVMQIVHIPFHQHHRRANNGAPVRIIGGSGAGGLVPDRPGAAQASSRWTT